MYSFLDGKIFKQRIDDKSPIDRHISLSDVILQELLQQLRKYHLNTRKSCSLNTSQGFQNAKMIYFQWNSKHKPTMSDNCLRQRTCLCYTYVNNYYGSWLSEAAFTLVPKHAQTKHVSKIISPISSNCNCRQRQMLFFTNFYYSSRMRILWHLLQVRRVEVLMKHFEAASVNAALER